MAWAAVALDGVPCDADAAHDFVLLFSESPSRFVVEVRPESFGELAALWEGLPFCRLGEVTTGAVEHGGASPRLTVQGRGGSLVIDAHGRPEGCLARSSPLVESRRRALARLWLRSLG